MNSHKHARLTPKGRALLVSRVVDQGWTAALASDAAGVSRRTGFKWLVRFKTEGEVGLIDRSSRPLRSPRAPTPQEQGGLEGMRRIPNAPEYLYPAYAVYAAGADPETFEPALQGLRQVVLGDRDG